ncbi:hypothetical protein [Kushneria aurantia]|uniref:Uncharacterized protein n=1 Tax=Kushneria aurantia TaxID=504092 RepID=A0ABV6G2Z1_9GAMM|nr:hypothetical protein [Kushneria aurantia]
MKRAITFLLLASSLLAATAWASSVADRRAEIEAGSDLGMSAETFVTRFNDLMAESELPYQAQGELQNLDGPQGTFSETFSDNMGLLGSVKPESQLVNGLVFFGRESESGESGARIQAVAARVLAASSDDLSVDDAMGMVLVLNQAWSGTPVSQTQDGIEYGFSRDPLMGNMYTVTAVE